MLKSDIFPERKYAKPSAFASERLRRLRKPEGPRSGGSSSRGQSRKEGAYKNKSKVIDLYHIVSQAINRSHASDIFIVILMVSVSIVIHLVGIEAIYLINKNASVEKKPVIQKHEVAFDIKPLPVPKPMAEVKRPLAKKLHTRKTHRVKKRRKVKPQKRTRMTARQLASLGRQYMGLLQKGAFPSLILSYASPSRYIQEMYALGCKTVVLASSLGKYYEVNLLSGETFPFSVEELQGFSLFKRVIQDREWYPVIQKVAFELGVADDSIEILLLVPLTVEEQWIGYQVNTFDKMNLKVSDVESVEAVFENSHLKLRRLHLKDGSERRINDPYGI